jgi:hypothetical protein
MVKRSIAVGCGLLVVSAWQVPSAVAAGTAVSGVELAWADATHAKVKVTWTETTPVANTLRLETQYYGPVSLGSIPASAPNELLVNTSYLGSTTFHEISKIVVTDSAGGEATSPDFDRYARSVPFPTLTFAPQGGVKWDVHADADQDTTPDDPLDVAGGTQYVARLRYDKQPHTIGDCGETSLPPTTATNGIVPDTGDPAAVTILSANEWLPRFTGTDEAAIQTSSVTIAAPAVTPYGNSLTLTGSGAHGYVATGGSVVCQQSTYLMNSEPVALQGRNSPTSAWYVVKNGQADGNGNYSFTVANPGAREYRVVRANTAYGSTYVQYGATTAAKAVKATTKVVSAKFIAPVITYGTKPQAYLWVDPAGTQQAALQFKNATGAWQGLSYKTLYAGKGLLQFAWSKRGATQFRWWVPGSTTSTGLHVEPVYSAIFTLTVR